MSDMDDSSDADNQFDISDPKQVLKLSKLKTTEPDTLNALQAELKEMEDLDLESLGSDCNLYSQL